MKEVTVLAPATVANVVCGFDCLGFALESPCDVMTLAKSDAKGVSIRHLDGFGLPVDARENIAGVALTAILNHVGADFGFDLTIDKKIKPGSGVGSSSASAVGAVVAAAALLGNPFSESELLEFAMLGEFAASQGRHADNVAPALFGGFTLVRSVDPLDIVRIAHPELYATVIHPQIEIRTADARRMLPAAIPLKAAVRGWSNVGALVAGLSTGDYGLISRALTDDIVEPVRKTLIPHFDAVKEAALKTGAIGGGIAGSGPSIFMFSRTRATADEIASAMRRVYEPSRIKFEVYVSAICPLGARVG